MNIRKIFSPLIAIVIALLIYQSYNIYAENEPAEGIIEEAAPLPVAEATAPMPPVEGTVPPAEPTEGTVPVPSLPLIEGAAPLIPAGVAPLALPGIEGARPLPPMEGTAPLPPAEATAPLPPAEGTAPPLIEIPVPVHPPKEEMFWLSPPSERKKEYVGMEKCRICHTTQYDKWNETLHAKWQPSFTTPEKKQKARMECETCHGPGSLHIENDKERLFITTFGPQSKDTREEQNAVCLTCHNKGGLYYWDGGTHGRTQRCVDCHQVMEKTSEKNLLSRSSEKELCLRCHLQKKAQALRSPHLSRDDAKMTCSTCHAPHGSDTPGLLSASSVNENCYRCHADKRGPYLFDHFPVQENCLLCHDPHASANKSLLKMRQPFLCLECHSNLPNTLPSNADPHRVLDSGGRYTYNKGCINCHPMIHGSRHPSGVRLQR